MGYDINLFFIYYPIREWSNSSNEWNENNKTKLIYIYKVYNNKERAMRANK